MDLNSFNLLPEDSVIEFIKMRRQPVPDENVVHLTGFGLFMKLLNQRKPPQLPIEIEDWKIGRLIFSTGIKKYRIKKSEIIDKKYDYRKLHKDIQRYITNIFEPDRLIRIFKYAEKLIDDIPIAKYFIQDIICCISSHLDADSFTNLSMINKKMNESCKTSELRSHIYYHTIDDKCDELSDLTARELLLIKSIVKNVYACNGKYDGMLISGELYVRYNGETKQQSSMKFFQIHKYSEENREYFVLLGMNLKIYIYDILHDHFNEIYLIPKAIDIVISNNMIAYIGIYGDINLIHNDDLPFFSTSKFLYSLTTVSNKKNKFISFVIGAERLFAVDSKHNFHLGYHSVYNGDIHKKKLNTIDHINFITHTNECIVISSLSDQKNIQIFNYNSFTPNLIHDRSLNLPSVPTKILFRELDSLYPFIMYIEETGNLVLMNGRQIIKHEQIKNVIYIDRLFDQLYIIDNQFIKYTMKYDKRYYSVKLISVENLL